ncbi:MAG: hypothetical protein Q7S52_00295 [bacterium]|nr:hypothetical protein [bacterium]
MSTIEEFKNIEMKIGTILSAEYIEGADKLLKLSVDFGLKPPKAVRPIGLKHRTERCSPDPALRDLGPKKKETQAEGEPVVEMVEEKEERDVRQILSGIREYYSPEQLIGKQCPFVTNLEPRTMRGLVSEGMILAVKTKDGGAILLHPDKETEAGSMLS